jgi:hypothetical protein
MITGARIAIWIKEMDSGCENEEVVVRRKGREIVQGADGDSYGDGKREVGWSTALGQKPMSKWQPHTDVNQNSRYCHSL